MSLVITPRMIEILKEVYYSEKKKETSYASQIWRKTGIAEQHVQTLLKKLKILELVSFTRIGRIKQASLTQKGEIFVMYLFKIDELIGRDKISILQDIKV